MYHLRLFEMEKTQRLVLVGHVLRRQIFKRSYELGTRKTVKEQEADHKTPGV